MSNYFHIPLALDGLRRLIFGVVAMLLVWALVSGPDSHLHHSLPILTRSDCLMHRPWLILVFLLSDLATAMAYFVIPVVLLYYGYVRRHSVVWRRTISRRVLFWFAAFILLCGVNHVMDATVLRFAWYEVFAVVKAAMALVSLHVALWEVWRISEVMVLPRGALDETKEMIHEELRRPMYDIYETRRVLRRVLAQLDLEIGPDKEWQAGEGGKGME